MNNDVKMRVVTHHGRDIESRPPPAPTPLSHPSPSESTSPELPSGQRDRGRDHDPLDIISIDSSSSSRRRPPLRSPGKTKKLRGLGQLMTYVLVPPIPPGARKSDYAPVRQRPRTQQRQTAAKGKGRAGDNLGSKELVHVLQVAPTSASKSKSREPVLVPPPLAKQRPAKTMTTTDAQVFDGSWSATAVFTISGESLGSEFLHGNKAGIVPVSQPTTSPALAATTPAAPRLSPPARYPNPRRNCNGVGKCLSGNRAGGGAAGVPPRSQPRPAGAENDEGEGEVDGHRWSGTPG
ncbi:hypothetical protein H4582DRAFT_364219 [Lactarius indigo]|nr:hypothetical protein H4582DRAFT_364219 [Lactarius indigo]